MTVETAKIEFKPIEIPRVRRSWGVAKIILALLLLAVPVYAWRMGYLSKLMGSEKKFEFRLVEVDRGDIDVSVVETGSIESANNTTIRCQVEALLGAVGGSAGGTGKAGGTGGGTQAGGGGAGGASGGASGGSGANPAATGKAKTAKKAGASSSSKTGTTAAGTSKTSTGTAAGSSGSSTSSSASGASGSMSASGASTAAVGATSTSSKPVIRSFTMQVVAYMPLRPATTKAVDTAAQKKAQQGQGGGGGGGGGRGGGGGGGGRGGGGGGRGGGGGGGRRGMMMSMEDEKPGSTTIVYIIPEGTKVKAGDLLCNLDSSAFQDEEQAQIIRFLQAKSFVEQANSSLEVSKISLAEYRDGIYPQDLQLVKQYIEACELDNSRLKRTAEWSRAMRNIGYRTEFQARGDELAYAQTIIALGEAHNMYDRLAKQTGPKLIKSLEANLKAIEADKYTQEASFNLEKIRLERIRKNIKNCTLYAPADGVVVYANQTSAFGTVTAPIAEGVTVRQDQPIINLPDPLRMRVKARINESKLAYVQAGQAARIVVDAFRERPLKGLVRDVTAINTPLNASDVRVYYANVDIAQGFADLRPGLSAEVVFLVDSRHDVTRVPLDAIRWIHERGYVAVYDPASTDSNQKVHWKEVRVGLSDLNYAEVLSGVEPGDRLVASPRELDLPPNLEQAIAPSTKVAELAR